LIGFSGSPQIYRYFTVVAHGYRMMAMVRKFRADDIVATAIEYGSIAAGNSLAIIVNGLGTRLNTRFISINSALK
jgi:pilus assembly protein Flp/PilA